MVQLAEPGEPAEQHFDLSGDAKENLGRDVLQTDERLKERMARQTML